MSTDKVRAQHTPTPWYIDASARHAWYIMAGQPETAKEGEELPPEYEVAAVGGGTDEINEREKADACHIIHCVNTYDAMLIVLQRFVAKGHGGNGSDCDCGVCDAGRMVLAAAKAVVS